MDRLRASPRCNAFIGCRARVIVLPPPLELALGRAKLESLFHDLQVVSQVTGGEPGERSDAQAVALGGTGLVPASRAETPQQQQVGLPQVLNLGDDLVKVAQAEAAVGVEIFVPAWQLGRVAGSKSQHPVTEHPLGVGTVGEHLAKGPAVGRMNLVNLVRTDRRGQVAKPVQLLRQDQQRTVSRRRLDQLAVVRRGYLGGIAAARDRRHHGANIESVK